MTSMLRTLILLGVLASVWKVCGQLRRDHWIALGWSHLSCLSGPSIVVNLRPLLSHFYGCNRVQVIG